MTAIGTEGEMPGFTTRLGALARRPLLALAEARGRLFPFVPVLMSLGIGAYFSLSAEPSRLVVGVISGIALLALWAFLRAPEEWRPVAAVPLFVTLGFLLILARSHMVAAPVLGFRYYGPVEGRLVEIDRSGSDRLRLTLDQVVLSRVAPERTPERVRISLMEEPGRSFDPGVRVMLTGHLGPPGRPAEPGGFDFRRVAWFEQIGGIGYTRNPVMTLAPSEDGWSLAVARMRMALSAVVRAHIPGDAGGYAAAVTTGDRSGISAAANEAMRASNLSHLLSISGMHMSMLAGFIFAVVRSGLALIPALALRLSTRKLAAAIALAASAFYLMLAGRDVATERSFIMVAMMLVAVLCDRRAISVRSVALAAVVVLALRPESLTNAGFQMSFAATAALVVAFGWISGRERPWPRWSDGVIMLLFSSAVAGGATMPLSAAIFNRVAEYGLLANLLAVPLMGALVMPPAVIALVVSPLGLEAVPLAVAGLGAEGILRVADWIAGLDGAVAAVTAPAEWAIGTLTLGALWLVLWPGRARWAGLLPLSAAIFFWQGAGRPPLLVSETGAISGVMTSEGRALSRPRGDAFAASSWLQRDGDLASTQEAGARQGMRREGGVARHAFGGWEVVHATGKGAEEAARGACRARVIVIAAIDVRSEGNCLLLDRARLAETGAVALWLGDEGQLRLLSAAEVAGQRLWTMPPAR